MIRAFLLALLVQLAATAACAETLVAKLIKDYEAVQTLTCDLRRDNESGPDKMRFLSRIYYARPDRLHVENSAPIERTIISDGTNFYSYIQGDPKGFSRPVSQLDAEMLRSLRKVPGTAMDHLLRLENVPETELPATAQLRHGQTVCGAVAGRLEPVGAHRVLHGGRPGHADGAIRLQRLPGSGARGLDPVPAPGVDARDGAGDSRDHAGQQPLREHPDRRGAVHRRAVL